MSKTLTLIYGEDSIAMKALSSSIREKDKNANVGLRAAYLFTADQVEPCDKVIALDNFSAIEAAYGDKVESYKPMENKPAKEGKAPKADKPAKEGK